MNQKEIKDLIEFLIEKDISEFEMERGDVKLRIKRATEPQPATQFVPLPAATHAIAVQPAPVFGGPVAVPAAASAAKPGAGAEIESELLTVKSPIVGTYYEAPSPGSPPFAKVGDSVETGQVLCIIEAMKLMNEIESDFSGVIAKILVKNGQPVEYGQPLFAIQPRK